MLTTILVDAFVLGLVVLGGFATYIALFTN